VNKDNFAMLQSMTERAQRTVSANELTSDEPRTLLYGTMPSGNIVHVYLKDGLIHRLTGEGSTWGYQVKVSWVAGEVVNGLWFRPEYSDFDFAWLVLQRGAHIRWCSYTDAVHRRTQGCNFHGALKEDVL
jgi:hypothetical protein